MSIYFALSIEQGGVKKFIKYSQAMGMLMLFNLENKV